MQELFREATRFFLFYGYPALIIVCFVTLAVLIALNRKEIKKNIGGREAVIALGILIIFSIAVKLVAFSPSVDIFSASWEQSLVGKTLTEKGFISIYQKGSFNECTLQAIVEHPAGYGVIAALVFLLGGIYYNLILYS